MYKLSELKNGLFAIYNCKGSFVTTHSDAVVNFGIVCGIPLDLPAFTKKRAQHIVDTMNAAIDAGFVGVELISIIEAIEFTTRFKLIDKDDPDKKQYIHIREASDDPEALLMQVRAFLNSGDKNSFVSWWAIYEVDSDNKMIDGGMWSDSEI
jgi:hypothetical protein